MHNTRSYDHCGSTDPPEEERMPMPISEDTWSRSRTGNGDPVSPLFGSCPLPFFDHKQIVLGHGSGGKLTAELIEKIFLPAFPNPVLDKLDDQAVLTSAARASLSPPTRSS